MRKIYLFVFVPLIVMSIASCAPDPRKSAQATKIEEQAQQDALNQAQARTQSADKHTVEMQRLALEQAHRQATAAAWDAMVNQFLATAKVAGSIGLAGIILGLAVTLIVTTFRVGNAVAYGAEFRARQIFLDVRTRTYPALESRDGKYIANISVHGVLPMTEAQAPDRQMITTTGAVHYVGALAQEAKDSTDPAGVAIINPPMADVKDELITLGRDIFAGKVNK